MSELNKSLVLESRLKSSSFNSVALSLAGTSDEVSNSSWLGVVSELNKSLLLESKLKSSSVKEGAAASSNKLRLDSDSKVTLSNKSLAMGGRLDSTSAVISGTSVGVVSTTGSKNSVESFDKLHSNTVVKSTSSSVNPKSSNVCSSSLLFVAVSLITLTSLFFANESIGSVKDSVEETNESFASKEKENSSFSNSLCVGVLVSSVHKLLKSGVSVESVVETSNKSRLSKSASGALNKSQNPGSAVFKSNDVS